MSTEQMSLTIHGLNEQVAQLKDENTRLTSELDEAQKERDEARACFRRACEKLEQAQFGPTPLACNVKSADVWQAEIEAEVRGTVKGGSGAVRPQPPAAKETHP